MGLWLILCGLVKKVLVADVIGANLVDGVFETPELYSSLEALVASYGYTVQIYCDFSGYSDIAVGTALLIGYRLPENFDRPFQSGNLAEFWRRWHKSLSFWLRDYLYIPLGGSRHGTWKTYRNLFITMLLGGLWHGNTWNYVIWGALHGVGLAGVRMFQRWRGETEKPSLFIRGLYIALTFHFVVFCFVIFRAETMTHAWGVFTAICLGGFSMTNLPWWVGMLVGAALIIHWTPRRWNFKLGATFQAAPSWAQALALAWLAIGLYQVKGADIRPFIYFQF